MSVCVYVYNQPRSVEWRWRKQVGGMEWDEQEKVWIYGMKKEEDSVGRKKRKKWKKWKRRKKKEMKERKERISECELCDVSVIPQPRLVYCT